MATTLTVESGQPVLYNNNEYAIASQSRDEVRITQNYGKYIGIPMSEFMSDYTQVPWGWVPKPQYRINQQNGDTHVIQSFNIMTNDLPVWYYVIQRRDDAPRLVTEREMRTEVKEDIKNTWVKMGKEVVYVIDYRPGKVLKVAPALTRNPNITSLSDDTIISPTKQPRYNLYEKVERGPHRDKTIEAIHPRPNDNFMYIFSDFTAADEMELQ